jgi:hypothetical protein
LVTCEANAGGGYRWMKLLINLSITNSARQKAVNKFGELARQKG